jgi:hypothetical protein
LRKTSLLIAMFIPLVSMGVLLGPRTTYGATAGSVNIEKIDHMVMPIYGGAILINDTITISSSMGNGAPESFSLGFPLKYRMNLQQAVAYDMNDANRRLNVTLDAGLGVIGYYGVTVTFPQEVRDLMHDGQPYTFTVVFVLTGLIESSTRSINATTRYVFTADFPIYPSLTQNASICNVDVLLPRNTQYDTSTSPFNIAVKDDRYHLNHTIAPLHSFSHISTQVSYTSNETDTFVLFSVNRLEREVAIDSKGQVSATDLFLLESNTAFTFSSVKLQFPKDAHSISAFDEQRKKINIELLDNETNTYDIPLSLPANQAKSLSFVYSLSGDRVVEQNTGNRLNLSLLENLEIMARTLTLEIVFPEGAAVQSFPEQAFSIERSVFQDTLWTSAANVTWLQDEEWSFTYRYSVFWASFRPTLWISVLVLLGSIVAVAWQRPEAPTPVSVVMVPRETLDEFVDTYEEKKKALAELEQITRRGRKGKISRRRYKIRKTTIENRLSALSKRLVELRQEIMRGGAKYADVMRQLEVAETELDSIDADIRRIEVRFKRGEISAQTYRQLLEDDLRRRDRAKTTIDGLLLRLQE